MGDQFVSSFSTSSIRQSSCIQLNYSIRIWILGVRVVVITTSLRGCGIIICSHDDEQPREKKYSCIVSDLVAQASSTTKKG